ncbi:hypothetical protein JCGZ_03022 [Jatropha curcas]|uniref:Uncharacterized protein n=1 Tax=Jatropha curcas TaxID=180498 RepID=A0A067LCD8_JATCU|nr:hypothetical protein JCGZ_03022 [Jatropha curcas]
MSELIQTESVCGRNKVGRHAFPKLPFPFRIDPSREIALRAWHRRLGQRLVRVSPIPEPTPVSPVIRSSSSDSVSDSGLVEMADNTVNEIGFSPAQIRTITEIIAAALAQERAQN